AAWTKLGIEELAYRIDSARDWIRGRPDLGSLPLVLFGHGAGAAAALVSAAARPAGVRAIVVRDGAPDLAGRALATVRAPTLFLAGSGSDSRAAATWLRARVALPDASGTRGKRDGLEAPRRRVGG